MSFKSIKTEIPDQIIPYYHFPERPTIITVENRNAYEYISQGELSKLIKFFSDTVNLKRDFDVLCVNQKGGSYFADELMRIQKYRGAVIDIEYHQNGKTVKPIPEDLLGFRLGVIDDVLDTFVSGAMIQKAAPDAKLMYMTKKREVTPSNSLYNCSWACEVDNKWLLGAGMNGDIPEDECLEDWGREFPAIAVRIES